MKSRHRDDRVHARAPRIGADSHELQFLSDRRADSLNSGVKTAYTRGRHLPANTT